MARRRCDTCGETFFSREGLATCTTCSDPSTIGSPTDEALRLEAVSAPKGRSQTVDIAVLKEAVESKKTSRRKQKQTLDLTPEDTE